MAYIACMWTRLYRHWLYRHSLAIVAIGLIVLFALIVLVTRSTEPMGGA